MGGRVWSQWNGNGAVYGEADGGGRLEGGDWGGRMDGKER